MNKTYFVSQMNEYYTKQQIIRELNTGMVEPIAYDSKQSYRPIELVDIDYRDDKLILCNYSRENVFIVKYNTYNGSFKLNGMLYNVNQFIKYNSVWGK